MNEDSYISNFFSFFSQNGAALFNFFLCLVAFMLVVQWAFWLFKWGRFKKENENPSQTKFIYLITEFFVRLINDFRHLLALIVIVVFAWVLIYSVIHAITLDNGGSENFENLKDVLQAVISTLGGIVGSIIGYYFGESVGRKREAQADSPDELEQNENSDAIQSADINLGSEE